jgi:hypothetical protein
MGAHVSTRQISKPVFRSGLVIRATQNGLKISFGPFARPWPLIWKRAALAGMRPEVLQHNKPKLLIQTSVDGFLELLEPRTQKRKTARSKFVPPLAGLAVILIAFTMPLHAAKPKAPSPQKKSDSCSLTRLKQVLAGDAEVSEIEFTKAENFGGITSGVLTCKGARYSYTLESKGLERVLKVGKLNS